MMADRLRASQRSTALLGTVLAALGATAPCSVAATSPPSAAISAHAYAAHVAEASHRFGIPEKWIWRVMHAESRGNARAVSHAGAMGVMQIMPATWAMLTARHRLGSDPFDVRANILAGAAYLRSMWDRYRDVRLMLAAYNAGPGRADAYAAGRLRLPAETVAYVAKIAPALGAAGSEARTAEPAPRTPGWREAGLFSVRDVERGETMEPSASSRPSGTGSGLNPLFVPLSGRGE